jgi:hypothetical protein
MNVHLPMGEYERGQRAARTAARSRLGCNTPKAKAVVIPPPPAVLVPEPVASKPAPKPRKEPTLREINTYVLRNIAHTPLRWRQVADDTCLRHGVSMREVRGRGQARDVMSCRAEIIWRLHELGLSAHEIGIIVKREDTSVNHNLRLWRRLSAHPGAMRDTLDSRSVVAEVVEQVAAEHGIAVSDIMSNRRRGLLSEARHEVMWRLFKNTTLSCVEIGRQLNKDHSSVLYAIRKREAAQLSPLVDTRARTKQIAVENHLGAAPELV